MPAFTGLGAPNWDMYARGCIVGLTRGTRREHIIRAAQKVKDNGGVYLVPAFTGLGAPNWDMYARGCIVGLTRGTRREHIIRAAQESIAYQVADLVNAMQQDTGLTLASLKADGGASRDHFLMQFQSDIIHCKVRRPAIRETTALGAAYLAGLGVGVWDSLDEIKKLWECDIVYEPQMSPGCGLPGRAGRRRLGQPG